MPMDRIRLARLRDRIMSPEAAAALFADGMTVGMSGFTRAGDCKAVPFALAERARHEALRITLMTGASLGNDIDKVLTDANVIGRRIPFQSDPTLRRKINALDWEGAKRELMRWNKAGGRVLAGLTRRRQAEVELIG